VVVVVVVYFNVSAMMLLPPPVLLLRMGEVNPRRARLVLGWMAVFGRVYRLGM